MITREEQVRSAYSAVAAVTNLLGIAIQEATERQTQHDGELARARAESEDRRVRGQDEHARAHALAKQIQALEDENRVLRTSVEQLARRVSSLTAECDEFRGKCHDLTLTIEGGS